MAYDAEMAERIRALVDEPGLSERKMFGGLAFLVNGHMAVAANNAGNLMVRVDPAAGAELTDGVHVGPVVMRGRAMKGWLAIAADALTNDDDLLRWIDRGLEYARSLPPKD